MPGWGDAFREGVKDGVIWRRPERTLWYCTVQTYFETWQSQASGAFGESPPAYVEFKTRVGRAVYALRK